jgi:LmbE family N-acetylglucosaminyl deacetylase
MSHEASGHANDRNPALVENSGLARRPLRGEVFLPRPQMELVSRFPAHRPPPMFQLGFDGGVRPLRSILCLGAHADDIEIGCGGTLLKLLAQHPGLRVTWIVLSADAMRAAEARHGAREFLKEAGTRKVIVKRFTDSRFPQEARRIKAYFESIKGLSPDLVLTHYRQDLHQDHRLVAELTWNTFRSHLILEYEIPKYDGDMGRPNVYVSLDDSVCNEKVRHIMACHASQRRKQWFTQDTFLALMRLRGIETGGASRYAEAFYGWKLVL